jgi:hypothetical protein
VVAQVLEDVKAASSYQMYQLFGDDALFDTLVDVTKEYHRQTGW